LGGDGELAFTQSAEGLRIKLPAQQAAKGACTFRINGALAVK